MGSEGHESGGGTLRNNSKKIQLLQSIKWGLIDWVLINVVDKKEKKNKGKENGVVFLAHKR